eukprot:2369742-Karenia_brevis.AAC.1
MASWTWEQVLAAVPHVKVTKMFDAASKRLEMAVPAEEVVKASVDFTDMKEKDYVPEVLAVALKQRLQKQKSARVLQCIAPMGDLERKLQEFLDKEKV